MLRQLITVFMDHDPRLNVIYQSPKELRDLIPPSKSWFHRNPDEGIPIGNLTSQFGANVYLNDLDHYIVRKLRPLGYIRYMDDLTLFHRDPEALKTMIAPIDDWIKQNRKQELNYSKTTLQSLKSGIDYLGYRIIQTGNTVQPARIRATKKRKWDLVNSVRILEAHGLPNGRFLHPLSPQVNEKKARLKIAPINARLGLLQHADSFNFKHSVLGKLDRKIGNSWVTLDESGAYLKPCGRMFVKPDLSAIILRKK